MKVGDGNNKYFFFVLKVRVGIKYIDYIINDSRVKVIRNKEIE